MKKPAHKVIIEELRSIGEYWFMTKKTGMPFISYYKADHKIDKARTLIELLGQIEIPKDEREAVAAVVRSCSRFLSNNFDLGKICADILND